MNECEATEKREEKYERGCFKHNFLPLLFAFSSYIIIHSEVLFIELKSKEVLCVAFSSREIVYIRMHIDVIPLIAFDFLEDEVEIFFAFHTR